jgi:hypothetical protein
MWLEKIPRGRRLWNPTLAQKAARMGHPAIEIAKAVVAHHDECKRRFPQAV